MTSYPSRARHVAAKRLLRIVRRFLNAGMLYCSGDGPGLRKALKAVWPRSLAQKCQAHKIRNILGKPPQGVRGEIKKQIHRVFSVRRRRGHAGQRP